MSILNLCNDRPKLLCAYACMCDVPSNSIVLSDARGALSLMRARSGAPPADTHVDSCQFSAPACLRACQLVPLISTLGTEMCGPSPSFSRTGSPQR